MNSKCEAHFLAKKNPRKYHWTVFFRRLHKKGASEETQKKRTRKTVKVQRPVIGFTADQITAKRNQSSSVREAARKAATDAAKNAKKAEQEKKKAEKTVKVNLLLKYFICHISLSLDESSAKNKGPNFQRQSTKTIKCWCPSLEASQQQLISPFSLINKLIKIFTSLLFIATSKNYYQGKAY